MLKEWIGKLASWLKRPGVRRKGLLLVAVFAVMLLPGLVQAGITDVLLTIVAKIFELFTRLVGFLLFLEVKALIGVAQYSNFVSPGPTAVSVGWVVARDLANMFFILILLVIAFATIVGYEEYNLRRLLPRLLIMAVVINFSKTITGIFIDLGQVIMLTFVNGFKEAAGGNFLKAFQVDTLLRLSQNGEMSAGGLVVGMMLAFVMVLVAAGVVLVMLITLAFRIVMLWILIILAPIAFLASTIPPGQKYYGMWWDELKRYIIYGPVVAFFLWLALLTSQVSGGKISQGVGVDLGNTGGAVGLEAQGIGQQGSGGAIPTQAASSDVLLSMVIFTSLLFGGLKVATQVGGVAGGALSSIKGGLKKATRFAGRQAMKPVRDLSGAAMSRAGRALAKVPLVRGLGATMAVQGDRMKAKRAAERARFRGSAEERAAISPSFAGRRLRGLGPGASGSADRKRFLQAGEEANTSRAINQSWGGKDADERRKNFEERARGYQQIIDEGGTDAEAAKKGLKGMREANFDMVPKEELPGLFAGMKGERFAQVVNEGNLGSFLDNASLGQVAELQKNVDKGSPVRQGVDKFLEEMDSETLSGMRPEIDKLPLGATKNPAIAQWAFENSMQDRGARRKLMSTNEGREHMQTAAKALIEKAAGDDKKVASLMADAISVGAITADDINADKGLRDAAGSIDPRTLLKTIDTRDTGQRDAATAVMTQFQEINPERAAKLRKTGNYDAIMPEHEEVTSDMVLEERSAELDTGAIESAIKQAIERAGSLSAGDADKVRGSIEGLRRDLASRAKLEDRMGKQGSNDKEIASQISQLNANMTKLLGDIRS